MRGGEPDDGDGDGDELEVVLLEEAPPAAPRRALLGHVAAWGGRHRRLLLVTALCVVALGAAHALVAVRGLRALERHVEASLVLRDEYDEYVRELRAASGASYRLLVGGTEQERIARVTADYRRRVTELAEGASDVVVLDPSLRRLRRSTVLALRSEAHEARAGTWFPPFRVHAAAQRVEDDVRGRRLDRGRRPGVPRLQSVAELRKPTPLLDEPTGARLFVSTSNGIVEVEVDTGRAGRIADVRNPVGVVAAAGGFVGMVDTGDGHVVPFGSSTRGRPVGRYDEVLAHADDPGLVWFLTRPLDEFDPRPSVAHAFDREGVRRDEVTLGEGTVAALSRRWLVRARYREDDASFEVVDRRNGRVVGVEHDALPSALRGDLLAWWGPKGLLVRTLPATSDRVVPPPRPGLLPGQVLVSPDGRRLAVVWARFGPGRAHEAVLAVHDSASLAVVHEVWTSDHPVFPQAAWSHSGGHLFVLETGPGGGGRLLAWREGTAAPKRLPIEGEFYGLSAF